MRRGTRAKRDSCPVLSPLLTLLTTRWHFLLFCAVSTENKTHTWGKKETDAQKTMTDSQTDRQHAYILRQTISICARVMTSNSWLLVFHQQQQLNTVVSRLVLSLFSFPFSVDFLTTVMTLYELTDTHSNRKKRKRESTPSVTSTSR